MIQRSRKKLFLSRFWWRICCRSKRKQNDIRRFFNVFFFEAKMISSLKSFFDYFINWKCMDDREIKLNYFSGSYWTEGNNNYLLTGRKVTLYTPRWPRDGLFCERRRSEQNNSSRVTKVYKKSLYARSIPNFIFFDNIIFYSAGNKVMSGQ